MKAKRNPPVNKGELLEVTINDITGTGEGIAKYDGFTIFVDDTVPGDTCKIEIDTVKQNYAKAKLIELLESSPTRRSHPFCPYSEICGGCSYSKLNYEQQLKNKQNKVENDLKRIGGFENIKVLPIIGGNEFHYRNKAQYKVSENGLGFYKKRSHDIVEIDDCKIQSKNTGQLIKLLDQVIKEFHLSIYNETTHKGLLRGVLIRSNKKDETMIVFIINSKKLPHEKEIIEKLTQNKDIISVYININEAKSNKVLGDKTLEIFKRKALLEEIGDKKFEISPTSFFQVNPEQTEVLYKTVKEFADLKPGERLFDLYCGTGTIGIYISDENTPLTGVEINKEAVKDAVYNAELNNIMNAKFLSGKAEEIVPSLNEKPDCVILDPPRKGCERSLLELLFKIKPKRIVYVSCDSATLSRDLKILSEKFTIKKVQPIDLFPQTGHVETVVLMSRIEGK